jgi:hypothetical protein
MNSDKIPVLILVPNSTTFYNTHFFELINKTKVFDTPVILFNEDDAGISALVRKINSEYLSEVRRFWNKCTHHTFPGR